MLCMLLVLVLSFDDGLFETIRGGGGGGGGGWHNGLSRL